MIETSKALIDNGYVNCFGKIYITTNTIYVCSVIFTLSSLKEDCNVLQLLKADCNALCLLKEDCNALSLLRRRSRSSP